MTVFGSFASAAQHDISGSYSTTSAVRIFENAGSLTVSILVVFGPANMRDFQGVVVRRTGNTLKIVETDPDDESKACKMIIKVIGRKAQVTVDADKCDSDLGRIDGATKK